MKDLLPVFRLWHRSMMFDQWCSTNLDSTDNKQCFLAFWEQTKAFWTQITVLKPSVAISSGKEWPVEIQVLQHWSRVSRTGLRTLDLPRSVFSSYWCCWCFVSSTHLKRKPDWITDRFKRFVCDFSWLSRLCGPFQKIIRMNSSDKSRNMKCAHLHSGERTQTFQEEV